MSRRHGLTMSLGLLASSCAHTPRASVESSQTACPAPVPTRSEQVGLYDLVWRMQSDTARTSWSPVPDALFAFPLGPWECALGPLQASNSFSEQGASIERVRRLACTHKTGATMQTELRCNVSLPLAESAAANARRELTLTLSGAPQARFACEPERREHIEAVAGSARPSSSMCLTGARVSACDAASLPAMSSPRDRASFAPEPTHH